MNWQLILNILLNQYVFLFASALLIIGVTQIIKLIPCFKDNNWNITFPVVFGYIFAFAWAILSKYDIQSNIQNIMLYGTGITSFSTLLYSILKKMFSKDYKMSQEIENNELYNYINNLLSSEIKDFNTKTTIEKYGFIISIVSSFASVIDCYKKNDKDGAKSQLKEVISKFVKLEENSNIVDNLLNIIQKQYNIPVVSGNENAVTQDTLVKPN